MNSLIKHIGIGVGLGALTYFVIKKHCTADAAASSSTDTGLSSDLSDGAGGGGGIPDLGNASLSDNANTGTSNGLITPPNPNTTVISTPPSSTTINNAPVGTTNTTTIGNSPNPTPIIQPTKPLSSLIPISQSPKTVNGPPPTITNTTGCFPPYVSVNGQCVLPANYTNPLNLNLPKQGLTVNIPIPSCPAGKVLWQGKCIDLNNSAIMGTKPPVSMNTNFLKSHGAIYPSAAINSRFADGMDLSLLPDKLRNFYLGFGKLN